MKTRAAHILWVVVIAILLVSCGDDCPGIASCALQLAIRVTVSSASGGGPVENVSMQVSGEVVGPTACSAEASTTVCTVLGYPGAYKLVVGAPGFQSAERDVTVRGTSGQCDCLIVKTESIAVSLSPTP